MDHNSEIKQFFQIIRGVRIENPFDRDAKAAIGKRPLKNAHVCLLKRSVDPGIRTSVKSVFKI